MRKEVDTLTPAERLHVARRVPPKIKILLDCLYITGARISELLHVQTAECVAQGAYVRLTIHATKTHSQRYVFIKRDLFESVLSVWQTKACKYLFQGQGSKPISRGYVWECVHKALKRAHPHLWRHTRVTDLIEKGLPLDGISRFAGHSSFLVTMKIYGHTKLGVSDMAG